MKESYEEVQGLTEQICLYAGEVCATSDSKLTDREDLARKCITYEAKDIRIRCPIINLVKMVDDMRIALECLI
jgi:hypothetical protein